MEEVKTSQLEPVADQQSQTPCQDGEQREEHASPEAIAKAFDEGHSEARRHRPQELARKNGLKDFRASR